MCGIAGIIELRDAPVDPRTLQRLTDLIGHRGPDGAGSWFSADRTVALGHRRLAIIDPGEGGRQPMLSADGRHVITYNGEIYNFLELRSELERSGRRFLTESDTEVILAAWQEWGEGMLTRFNGMWAFAIHDTHTHETFLARDRFGVKPLLYAHTPERFVFASEMRALLRSGLVRASLDVEVARRLLLEPFAVEGSAHVLYSPLARLQAGHCLWLRSGRLEVKRWWRTLAHLPQVPAAEDERVAHFGQLFRDAVALRMRSDVPIGSSLSGGFDSSAVVCTMAATEKAGAGPRSARAWRYAIAASMPGDNDERPNAEAAAAWAGVSPTVLTISSDYALEYVERVLADLDDVYVGLPTPAWCVYREFRRQRVLVSLDGHGADELMGAYSQAGQAWSFRWRNFLARLSSAGSAVMNGALDSARALALKQRGHLFLRGVQRRLPPRLALTGEADALPAEWGSLNRRLYHMFHGTVLPTILRNFDRLAMAHGIEVRMPFMDYRLVGFTMA